MNEGSQVGGTSVCPVFQAAPVDMSAAIAGMSPPAADDIVMAWSETGGDWERVHGALPAHTGVMEVMGSKGDVKHVWNSGVAVEVEAARALFDRMRSKRYQAFQLEDDDETRGAQMRTFDPEAERVLFVPAMVGG